MRYLMVDRITEYGPGNLIKGVKNVSMSEDFLTFHFPENPVMPGNLLIESMVQLAGWFEAVSSGFKDWFLLRNVKRCKFYGFALPGDQIILEVKPLPGKKDGSMTYQGTGTVDGKKKATTVFEGKKVPIAEIDDPDAFRRHFQILREGLPLLKNG